MADPDGVVDARAENDQRFEKHRLASLLSQPAATDSELIERVKSRLDDHIGGTSLEDDITLLILQRKQRRPAVS